jgi:hypothetical protein
MPVWSAGRLKSMALNGELVVIAMQILEDYRLLSSGLKGFNLNTERRRGHRLEQTRRFCGAGHEDV